MLSPVRTEWYDVIYPAPPIAALFMQGQG